MISYRVVAKTTLLLSLLNILHCPFSLELWISCSLGLDCIGCLKSGLVAISFLGFGIVALCNGAILALLWVICLDRIARICLYN